MARDLEQVRQPPRPASPKVQPASPAESRPVRVAQPASPKLARGEPAQQEAPKSRDEARGDERRDEQTLSEILRIARKRVETPEVAPVLPRALADILPIEPPPSSRPTAPLGQAVVAPPSDLPTGLPVQRAGPPAGEAGVVPVPTVVGAALRSGNFLIHCASSLSIS